MAGAASVDKPDETDYRHHLLSLAFENKEKGDLESLKSAVRQFSIVLSLSPNYLPALLGLHHLVASCLLKGDHAFVDGYVRWPLNQLAFAIAKRMHEPSDISESELALCDKDELIKIVTAYEMTETSADVPIEDPAGLWTNIEKTFKACEFKQTAEMAGQLLAQAPGDPLIIVLAHLLLRCDELFPFLYPDMLYPYYDRLQSAIEDNEAAFAACLRRQSASLVEQLSSWAEGPLKAVLLAEIYYHNRELAKATGVLVPYLKNAGAHPYAQYLYARFLLQQGVAQIKTAAAKAGSTIVITEADLKRKEAMWNFFQKAGQVIGSAMADYAELWFSQKTPEGMREAVRAVRASMLLGSDSAAYYLGQHLMSREGEGAYPDCTEEAVYCLVNAGNISPDKKDKRDHTFNVIRNILCGITPHAEEDSLLIHMRALRDQDCPALPVPAGVISPYSLCCEAIALFQSAAAPDTAWIEVAAKKLILAIDLERPHYLPALFLYELLLHGAPALLKVHPHWTLDAVGKTLQALAQQSHDANKDLEIFSGFPRLALMQLVRLRYIDYIRLKDSVAVDSLFKLPLWRELEGKLDSALFSYYLSRHVHVTAQSQCDLNLRAQSKRLLEKAIDLPVAQHALATMYEAEHNEGRATALFEKAAKKGLPESLCALAYRYLFGKGGLKVDPALALAHFYEAAQLEDGDARAQYTRLNAEINRGKSATARRLQEVQRAKEVSRRTAERQALIKDHWTQYEAYKTGSNGQSINPELALYHCVKAIGYGYEAAMVLLAEAYRDGFGVAQNTEKAKQFFDILIASGIMTPKSLISEEVKRQAVCAQDAMALHAAHGKPLPLVGRKALPSEPELSPGPLLAGEARVMSSRVFSPAAFAALQAQCADANAAIQSLKAAALQAQRDAASATERAAQAAAREAAAMREALEALRAENEALKKQAENRSRKLQERSTEIAQLKAELVERLADLVSLGRQLDAIKAVSTARVFNPHAAVFHPRSAFTGSLPVQDGTAL